VKEEEEAWGSVAAACEASSVSDTSFFAAKLHVN